MSKIIPLSIFDEINSVEYLLEAAFMAAGALPHEQADAMQSLLDVIQKRIGKLEANLEALSPASEGMAA